jgi:light-regulated signal transduction histidine kinase (bacteriophytochrome)
MRALIKDLLTYSQIGTKQTVGNEVDAEEILAEVLTYLRPRITELNASIISSPLPRVWIDRAQLVQLLQNLIGNALKFHGNEPPCIRIGVVRDGANWTFSICDNGIGIDPKYHRQIFELFRRLHTDSAYPGMGIGLASCKRIVERCGGRIWLTSQLGCGTTFFFTLPALPHGEDDVVEGVEVIDLEGS